MVIAISIFRGLNIILFVKGENGGGHYEIGTYLKKAKKYFAGSVNPFCSWGMAWSLVLGEKLYAILC
jgi:hypothetical protein